MSPFVRIPNTGNPGWSLVPTIPGNFITVNAIGVAYDEIGYGEEGYNLSGYDSPTVSASATGAPVWGTGSSK